MAKVEQFNTGDLEQREWLIPYMGPFSSAISATIRSFGLNSSVIPTNTARGYELARKYIKDEVCQPLRIVAGDILGILREKAKEGNIEEKYFIMLPTAAGPCRFGKYQEVIKRFMEEEGFGKVPLRGPSSANDYSDLLSEEYSPAQKREFLKRLLKGIIASDLLDDITLRTRPYAKDKPAVNQLRDQKLGELETAIISGADTNDLILWGQNCVTDFKKHINANERFPLVVYAGEIYIRQNDNSTNHVIEQLENNRLEVMRTPTREWITYINQINQIDTATETKWALKHFNLPEAARKTALLLKQKLKGSYIARAEKQLLKPFHEILEDRHCLPSPLEIIQDLEREGEFHSHIRGESALSIGIASTVMKNRAKSKKTPLCGMFHVGPFTCMQEGVAKAKIESMARRLRKTDPNLLFPIVHASFGDSPNPNLASEIAVFTEQCYQKRDLKI